MRRFQGGPCLTSTAASHFLSHILAACKRHTTARYEPEIFTKRDGYVTPISQAGCQVPERWDVSSSAAYPVPARPASRRRGVSRLVEMSPVLLLTLSDS